ncbi:MAG: UDP-N-acetylglucosamine diphosphorylase/glucosamine-1-phosphate N-acetyltransferase [Gammaproteobacteria bacterium]|nr:MAG: UDP-N-acetylglucosamine diphosphorylase/glucosamine-1-phosphate N-acetyltransferase [Gammaproteobacteria bacterium]
MATDIVVLAAGKGTRMKSSLPKVLHRLAGKTLLQHVLDTSAQLPDSRIIVVTGHGATEVNGSSTGDNLTFVEQQDQLGTAHAVLQAVPELREDSVVLVLYGDVPLIGFDTLSAMVSEVGNGNVVLLTVNLKDPAGYGRILRDTNNQVVAIVEEKDATHEQRQICEVNTGVLALTAENLQAWLPLINNDNAQGEYYLTDIIALACKNGMQIKTSQPSTVEEVQGVNNRVQLSELERFYQSRVAEQLMFSGVTLADPKRLDVRGELRCGEDAFIDVNAVFEGRVILGNNVRIGPNCQIINSVVGDNVEIKANTIIEDSQVARGCVIGPFARLRPGTVLEEKAKVGNFVETKKTRVGKGSKINHLSYVGDAQLGERVNIGAGTITCNYDGVNKLQTEIGDDAFIGSNTSLVAPVRVGSFATVGAGSTITRDVPDNELGLTRAEQKNISGWQRPLKKQ